MPKEIAGLAEGLLRDPTRVRIESATSTPALVEQSVHFVESSGKRHLLSQLLRDPAVTSAIVFARTKRGADRVALQLNAEKISATAMHGNLGQNARQRALEQFKAGQVRVLVATDLAARGIDVAASAMCSTTNFPMSRKATSTASAVPPVMVRRALPLRSAMRRS